MSGADPTILVVDAGDPSGSGTALPALAAALLTASLALNPLSARVTNVANDEIVSVPQEEYSFPLSSLPTNNYVADLWRYEQNEIVSSLDEEYWLNLNSLPTNNNVVELWRHEQNEIVILVPEEELWLHLNPFSTNNNVVELWKYEQNEIVSAPTEELWLNLNALPSDNYVAALWRWEQNEFVPAPVTSIEEDFWQVWIRRYPNNILPAQWSFEQNDIALKAPPDEVFYFPPRMRVEVPYISPVRDNAEIFVVPPQLDEDFWKNEVKPYFPNNRIIDRWLWEQYEAIPIGSPVPLTSSDLIAYSCVNRPLDDAAPAGGGIDVKVRPIFLQLTSTDNLEVVSSSASDTGQIMVIGRAIDGSVISSTFSLNGTTAVVDGTIFHLIFSIQYVNDAVGTLTVRRSPNGPAVCIIPSGERGVSAMFKGATSETVQVKRYDKFFWKNVHSTTTMRDAVARLIADPEARIKQGISTMVSDSVFLAHREVPPPGVVFVDDNVDQSVPGGGIIPPGMAIGIWVELDLPSRDVEHKSTFSMQIAGHS